jgi:hypothetical protein
VKQIAVPVTFSRSASHPFARPGHRPPSRGHAGACYPPLFSSVCLAAPLGRGGKMLLTDLCNRPTTRAPDGPFDFRAPWLAPPQITECFAGVTRLLPRDTRPPYGNPVPARTRLTARRRASVTLVRIASGCVSPLERRFTSSGDRRFWRRSPPCAGLFGRSAGSTSVPLTPLSSAAARRPSRDDVQMTVQIRLSPVARQCDRSSRIRAPFIDECSPAGAFALRYL